MSAIPNLIINPTKGYLTRFITVVLIILFLGVFGFFLSSKHYKSKYESTKEDLVRLENSFKSYKALYDKGLVLMNEGKVYSDSINKTIQEKTNVTSIHYDKEFDDWLNTPIPSGVYDLFNTNTP